MRIIHDLAIKPPTDKISIHKDEIETQHNALGIDKKGVFIGIPTYDGTVHVALAMALLNNIKNLEKAGYKVNVSTAGHCHVTTSRNELSWAFLMSDCDSLIMIDSDEWCEDGAFVKLMEHDVDLVCGVCPRKVEPITFSTARTYIDLNTNRLIMDPDTLLVQLEAAPTGLIRIKRRVFDIIGREMGKELAYEELGQKRMDYFEMVRRGGMRWGEDYAFSHKWNAMGGACWARPDISFKHFGQKCFEGNFAEYITSNTLPDGSVNPIPESKVA